MCKLGFLFTKAAGIVLLGKEGNMESHRIGD